MEVINIIDAVVQRTGLIYDTFNAVQTFYNGNSSDGGLAALRHKLSSLRQDYIEMGPEIERQRKEQGMSKPHGLVNIMNRRLGSLAKTLRLANDQISASTERGPIFHALPLTEKKMKSLLLRIDKEDAEVKHIMDNLRYGKTSVYAANLQERIDKAEIVEQFEMFFDWLCPSSLDPDVHQKRLRETCAPRTTSWITRHQLFEEWLDQGGSSLWMRGTCTIKYPAASTNVVDGTGKTFLAHRIVYEVQGEEGERQQLRYILGSILKQLINQTRFSLKEDKERLWRELLTFSRVYANTPRLRCWADGCSDLIQKLSDRFQRVYIILDGVEECANINEVFHYLRRSSARRTNLLISSGNHHAIAREMEHHPELEITYNLIKDDLAHYIDYRLTEDLGLKGLDGEFKDYLKRRLLENAQTTEVFLYVKCMLSEIAMLPQKSERINALDDLSGGLSGHYSRLLGRISAGRSRFLVRNSLIWLAYCARPMTLGEIAIASVLDPTIEFNEDQMLAKPLDLLKICEGLIEINQGTGMVELSANVRKYVMSPIIDREDSIEKRQNPHFMGPDDGHKHILKTALRYLSSRSIIDKLQLSDAPIQGTTAVDEALVLYSVFRWHEHARRIQSRDDDVNQALFDFFKNDAAFRAWADVFERHNRMDPQFPDIEAAAYTMFQPDLSAVGQVSANKIHYASWIGLAAIVEYLAKDGYDLNEECGSHGKPLNVAVREGHYSVVKKLLDLGADVNTITEDEHLLDFSDTLDDRECVDESVVSIGFLLLRFEADVDEVLYYAVKHMIEWRKVHQNDFGGAAEHFGSVCWRYLKKHFHDTVETKTGRNALHLASIEIAPDSELLVHFICRAARKHRIDLDVTDATRFSAIHFAVVGSQVEKVASLIGAGASVNLAGSIGYTPMHRAAQETYWPRNGSNQVEVMNQLIRAGAHVNETDDDGNTPLHYVASQGKGDLAAQVGKLLLEAGADIRAVNKESKTPYEYAVSNPYSTADLIRLLRLPENQRPGKRRRMT